MAQTHEDFSLPLHIPERSSDLPKLSWERAGNLIAQHLTSQQCTLWKTLVTPFTTEAQALRLIQSDPDGVPAPQTRHLARLSEEDVEHLLSSGFAERADLEHVHHDTLKVFSVLEVEKHRRRVIAWPQRTNEAERLSLESASTHLPVFPTVGSITATTAYSHAYALDFKKYFQQMEIRRECRNHFVFSANGKNLSNVRLRLTTIPTGAASAPIIAQLLMNAVGLAIKTEHDVEFEGLIDNVRISANNLQALDSAWRSLLKLLSFLGITIGEHHMTPTPYDFLGVRCDNVRGTVQLTQKTRLKLLHIADILEDSVSTGCTFSGRPRDILAMFGKTMFAANVLGFAVSMGNTRDARHAAYYVLKFVRRLSSKLASDTLSLDSVVIVWRSAVKAWADWVRYLLELDPTVVRRSNTPTVTAHLYTDASMTGWGAVCIRSAPTDEIRVIGARWSPSAAELHINTLELMAVRNTLRILGHYLENGKLRLSIDNTSTLSWVKRGSAKTYMENEIVRDIHTLAHANNIAFSAEYVKSCNRTTWSL